MRIYIVLKDTSGGHEPAEIIKVYATHAAAESHAEGLRNEEALAAEKFWRAGSNIDHAQKMALIARDITAARTLFRVEEYDVCRSGDDS